MNIFTAIYRVIKAANTSYLESIEDKKNFNMQQEAVIQERSSRALLKKQLQGFISVLNSSDTLDGIQVEVSPGCDKYVGEVAEHLECIITPIGNRNYILMSKEETLDE